MRALHVYGVRFGHARALAAAWQAGCTRGWARSTMRDARMRLRFSRASVSPTGDSRRLERARPVCEIMARQVSLTQLVDSVGYDELAGSYSAFDGHVRPVARTELHGSQARADSVGHRAEF